MPPPTPFEDWLSLDEFSVRREVTGITTKRAPRTHPKPAILKKFFQGAHPWPLAWGGPEVHQAHFNAHRTINLSIQKRAENAIKRALTAIEGFDYQLFVTTAVTRYPGRNLLQRYTVRLEVYNSSLGTKLLGEFSIEQAFTEEQLSALQNGKLISENAKEIKLLFNGKTVSIKTKTLVRISEQDVTLLTEEIANLEEILRAKTDRGIKRKIPQLKKVKPSVKGKGPRKRTRPKAKPKGNVQPKAKAQSKTKAKPPPKAKGQPEPEVQPKAKAKPKGKAKPKPKGQPEPEVQPKAKGQPEPEVQPKPKAEPKPKTPPEVKTPQSAVGEPTPQSSGTLEPKDRGVGSGSRATEPKLGTGARTAAPQTVKPKFTARPAVRFVANVAFEFAAVIFNNWWSARKLRKAWEAISRDVEATASVTAQQNTAEFEKFRYSQDAGYQLYWRVDVWVIFENTAGVDEPEVDRLVLKTVSLIRYSDESYIPEAPAPYETPEAVFDDGWDSPMDPNTLFGYPAKSGVVFSQVYKSGDPITAGVADAADAVDGLAPTGTSEWNPTDEWKEYIKDYSLYADRFPDSKAAEVYANYLTEEWFKLVLVGLGLMAPDSFLSEDWFWDPAKTGLRMFLNKVRWLDEPRFTFRRKYFPDETNKEIRADGCNSNCHSLNDREIADDGLADRPTRLKPDDTWLTQDPRLNTAQWLIWQNEGK